MPPRNQIWILGARSANADKSIPWTKTNLPNLSDPDVIIINLLSLNEHILTKIDRHAIKQAVKDKLENGGTVVFITARKIYEKNESGAKLYSPENNYFPSPFVVNVNEVSEGQTINYDNRWYPFPEYLKEVKKFKFTLEFLPTSNFYESRQYIVTDNNNNRLGGAFKFEYRSLNDRGIVIYLPPPTEISVEEGIDIVLRKFGKVKGKVSFPAWITELPLVPLTESCSNLNILRQKSEEIQNKIRKKDKEIQKFMNYYGLLTSRDDPLQDAVYQGFNILGINLRRKRAKNLEDGVFNFQNPYAYKYGVIEVKGSNKRTSMADILECSKWVDQYYSRGLGKAKGIFISNQLRLQKYPESLSKRIHFEHNEIEYAEEKKICILPTCVIFEAVRKILNSKNKPNRTDLEKILSTTSGLLTSLC